VTHHLGVSLVIQFSLALGLAGLFWPEKLMPVFEVLMFPWPSSLRTIRLNSIAAILLAMFLFLSLIAS
jgi:hypothetical protein